MEAVRRANPKFTNFRPRTAVDAVEQFCRMQRNGLAPERIPEALIQCASCLPDREVDLFEQWIVNPADVQGMDAAVIGNANKCEHDRLVQEHELRCSPSPNESVTNPTPLETCPEDEKAPIE